MNERVEPASRRALDVWQRLRGWLGEHGQAAVATVVSTWGSAPAPAGAQMIVAPGDRFEGSVSGGCVEADVLAEAIDAMSEAKPKLLEYGVSDEIAWRVGLTCGGTIKVLVEPLTLGDAPLIDKIIEARRVRKTVVLTTRIADGLREIYSSDRELPLAATPLASSGTVGLIDTADGTFLVQPLVPPVRILVAGATHIGQVFAEMARLAGFSVTVVDPRAMFATEERFGAAVAMAEWPAASFASMGLDNRTAVVALTHAAHIDDDALTAALRSPCMYIGALGSRVTNAKRMERLRAAGFTEEELKRIHAPIGLNIGAKGPAEIAVSILAEIIKVARSGE